MAANNQGLCLGLGKSVVTEERPCIYQIILLLDKNQQKLFIEFLKSLPEVSYH